MIAVVETYRGITVLSVLPVSELRAQGEVVGEEVLMGGNGPVQPEEGVVLHAGLPQVLTSPVVHHVEAQQCLPGLALRAGRRRVSRLLVMSLTSKSSYCE